MSKNPSNKCVSIYTYTFRKIHVDKSVNTLTDKHVSVHVKKILYLLVSK